MAAIFERVILKNMDCHDKRPLNIFSDYFIIFSKIVYYVNLKNRPKFIINNDFKYFFKNYQNIIFRFFLSFEQN